MSFFFFCPAFVLWWNTRNVVAAALPAFRCTVQWHFVYSHRPHRPSPELCHLPKVHLGAREVRTPVPLLPAPGPHRPALCLQELVIRVCKRHCFTRGRETFHRVDSWGGFAELHPTPSPLAFSAFLWEVALRLAFIWDLNVFCTSTFQGKLLGGEITGWTDVNGLKAF